MAEITLGQIASAIAIFSTIGGFAFAIYKFLKTYVTGKIENLETRVAYLEAEMDDSKEERLILVNGVLACLKGLKEQGCNGPVTEGIKQIENYLMRKSHD